MSKLSLSTLKINNQSSKAWELEGFHRQGDGLAWEAWAEEKWEQTFGRTINGTCSTDMSYLLVAVGDVSDFIPWEGDLGGQPVLRVIDMKPESIHSKQQLCALFILQSQ